MFIEIKNLKNAVFQAVLTNLQKTPLMQVMVDLLLFLIYSDHKIIYHNFLNARLQYALQQSYQSGTVKRIYNTFYRQNFKTYTVTKKIITHVL